MGIVYALLAALCNSSIGPLSRFSLKDLDFYQIAFGKCLLAFAILSVICLIHRRSRLELLRLRHQWRRIGFLSFWGIFVLYFFETKAFATAPVASVSFAVYATGIVTVILGYFLLGESLSWKKVGGIAVVILGSMVFTGEAPQLDDPLALGYALLGGLGYSSFLVAARRFAIPTSFAFLWWLLGLGLVFLLLPALFSSDYRVTSALFTPGALTFLFPLAIVPTIGGFLFTSLALQHTEASKVQVFEMSDPLFATTLGFLFLGESIGLYGACGGCLILSGLILVG